MLSYTAGYQHTSTLITEKNPHILAINEIKRTENKSTYIYYCSLHTLCAADTIAKIQYFSNPIIQGIYTFLEKPGKS